MIILDTCTISYPMILVSYPQAVVLIDRRIYHVEIHWVQSAIYRHAGQQTVHSLLGL